jgi:hypothetical protein
LLLFGEPAKDGSQPLLQLGLAHAETRDPFLRERRALPLVRHRRNVVTSSFRPKLDSSSCEQDDQRPPSASLLAVQSRAPLFDNPRKVAHSRPRVAFLDLKFGPRSSRRRGTSPSRSCRATKTTRCLFKAPRYL